MQYVAWGMALGAVTLAVIAWGQGFGWQFSGLSTYQIFPIFGLLAFSLMWSHYMAAALRMYFKLDRAVLKTYFEVTSLAVLAAIITHPGLLAWQLWRDGSGLPPGSELHYVAADKSIWIVFAMVSLFIFLAYEFRRQFGQKPWWKFVQYASDIAIFLILLHALNLGTQLQSGWFRAVWYFYGVTLLGAIVYIYSQKFKKKPANP